MPRILGSTGDGYESRPGVNWSAFSLSTGQTGTGALLFNRGHYNLSVLISAIPVARVVTVLGKRHRTRG